MIVENILVYEDIYYRNFLPLNYLRPVYDLSSGLSTILAKLTHLFPEAVINLHCRDYLKNITKQNHPGISVNQLNTGVNLLLLNGRLLPNQDFNLNLDVENKIFLDQYNEVVAIFLSRNYTGIIAEMLGGIFSSKELINSFRNKLKIETINAKLVEYPWELVNENKEQSLYDFQRLNLNGIIKSIVPATTQTKNEQQIYIGRNTKFADYTILDADQGPIYIGDNCQIEAFTQIKGPAYIGKGGTVQGLISNTAIGPASRVSGNVFNSIIGSNVFLNKVNQVAYSYISDGSQLHQTTTQYIKQQTPDIYLDGYQIETNEKFLGLYTGDYANLPFNNYTYSGSVVGVACDLAINCPAPRFTPSFINYQGGYKEKSLQQTLHQVESFQQDLEFTVVEKETLKTVYSFPEKKVNNLIE